MFKYHAAALIALLFLTSCGAGPPKSWNWGFRPRAFIGMKGFPEADTEYGKGFRDGCETGFRTIGASGMRLLKNRLDGYKMAKNPEYAYGWYDGNEQCVYIIDWDVI